MEKQLNEISLNYIDTCEILKNLKNSNQVFTIIYAHINKINSKAYIGQTNQLPEDRWGPNGIGYSKSRKFYNAIKKYGWDNFEHIILYMEIGVESLDDLERDYISKYNTLKNGYNLTYGGKKLLKHTDDQKRRISESCKRVLREKYDNDPKYRATVLKNFSMRKNRSRYGSDNSFYGKTHTSEMKNKFLTRSVRCIDTGEIFNSISDACSKYNIRRTGITACCSGHQHKCGGYSWEYVERINESV